MIHLITGGARSGKSSFAEQLILRSEGNPRIYIATMEPGNDPENQQRIAKHRADRDGKGFHTIECQTALVEKEIPEGSAVLLECITNLVANEMFSPEGAGEEALAAVRDGVDRLCTLARDVVFVTNDIFCDGVVYEPSVEDYRRTVAAIMRYIAARADRVTEMVSGIPLEFKQERMISRK